MELLWEETESGPVESQGLSQSPILKKTTVSNQTTIDDKFDSSHISRVKVKRKHLKERLSPFDVCQSSQGTYVEIVPPALPGTLPKDYQEITERLSGSLSAQAGHVTRSPDLAVATTSSSHCVHEETTVSGEGSLVSSFGNQCQAKMKLKQGSPNREAFKSCDPYQVNDIRITQYAHGKRKQIMKESLFKRTEQIGPVKRVFEPRFVNRRQINAAVNPGPDVNHVTMTAAAAAAVAATAPLIKYQHDLENKVSMIMNEMHDLQENTKQRRRRRQSHREAMVNEELHKRLDELTLMKLKELERLHTQRNQIIELAPSHGNGVSQPTKPIQSSSGIEKYEGGVNQAGYGHTVNSGHKHHLTDVERNSGMSRLPMGYLQQPSSCQDFREEAATPSQLVKQVQYAPAMKVARGENPNDDCLGYNARLSQQQQQQDYDENEPSNYESRQSPLDTPAPRKHAPVPHSITPATKPNGRLLQEILSHQSAVAPLQSHNMPTQEERMKLPLHDPIFTASTSETGKQVDQFLKKSLSSDVSGKLQAETIPQTASLMSSNRVLMDPSFQPSNWLIENHKKDDAHTALPAATLSRRTRFNLVPHHTHVISHVKPGQSSTVISQVETLLKRVQVSRGCLESNIEVIERSKRDQDSYNAMDAMLINGDTAEKKKLRQLVDTYISLIDSQNKEELFHHQRQMSEIPHSPPIKLISEKIHKLKTPVKDLAKPGRPPKKKVMARIDTGLRKPKDDEDGDKTKREIGALSSKEKREKRESKPHLHDRKKQPLKSFKPPEKYRDPRYMSKVYHKNLFFQGQRSTLQAAPYLRLANPSPETKRVKFSPSKDVNTRGSQTRRGVMEPDMHEQLSYPVDKLLHLVEDSEREFYQKYLAEKHRYPDTAIPLGSPRISSERREPLEIFNQQQQKNVAVINIVSQKPQLEIKHLPPVDIDTEVSSILEDEVISSFSPPPPPPPPPDMSRSDEDEVPAASGFVTFQGHHNYESQYNGPSFPPQVPVSQPQPRSDDVPAHLQRRDLLEQRAVEWIEQELMAKMISEFHHRLSSNTENRPDSLEQSLTDSSHTVNAIGSGGVQLFVDAGQPVNSDLVSSLIREVLEEDITKMLGHVRENPLRDRSQQILEQHLQDQHEEVSPHREILTPEITPVHSPIDSPPPVGDGWKLETPEPSYSEVSQEAESEVTPDHEDVDNLVSTPASPMVTPPPTPPPVSAFSSEPGHIDTPPPSSQDTPPLMRGDPDIVGTPSLTVDVTPPCSPIPMEETSRISSIPPLEGETTPPPTPSIKTKETTTPPSSESTTSCTSPEITETSGKEISAGEWLISQQSEGQVPKLLLEGVKPDQKGTEVSQTTSSDTLLETEELEADTVQDSLEEGEIRAGTNRQNIGDPVVAILTRLNQLSNKTGKGVVGGDPSSPGEISEGQRPLLAPNVVSALEDNIGFAVDGSDPQSPGEVKIETGEAIEPGEAPRELTKSNQLEKSALRLSDLNSGNSSSKEEKEDAEDPTLVSPGDGAGEEVRQGVKIIAPRVIHVGSKRPPDQKDKEETGEGTPQNVRGTRNRGAPDFDPYDSHATLEGNLRTRTLTPDAINMEALLQSGYLSQTFSQSDAGGQPLVTESKGTIGGGGGTLQLTEGMMGTTFGTTMTEDSLEVGTTKPKLSVQKPKAVSITLPSTDRGEEKIDWSGSESEGNPPGHETISDVSEISACDPNQD